MTTPTLLVLAAGMGSRYGGLKQLDSVGPDNETIMDYSIFDARRAGFAKVVFVIRKEMEEAFREKIGARYEKRLAVEYVFQETGKAANVIHDPFGVINADDFYGASSYRLLAHHLQSGSEDYAMVGFVLRNTLSEFGSVARGVCHVTEDGYLKDITELKSIEREGSHITNIDAEGQETVLTGNETVSMNMWGFTPTVFPQLCEHFERFLKRYGGDLKAECYLPSSVNTLIHSGQARVKVLRSCDAWFGVTYREDHLRVVESVTRLIEQGTYPRGLWR
jgi:NDP-sugar pyrophosphorylase family protein